MRSLVQCNIGETVESGKVWVNVEVAVVRQGRYLTIERGKGEDYGAGWIGFPGGKLDPVAPLASAIEQTARREVLEEVGLTLSGTIHYVESHTFLIDDGVVLEIVVLAQSEGGEPFAAAPDEVAAIAWRTAPEMLEHTQVQPFMHEIIRLVEGRRWALGW